MTTPEQIDAMLLQVAERSGGISPLLNAFFGFLHRRTDFYVVHGGKPDTSYEAGFGPGVARGAEGGRRRSLGRQAAARQRRRGRPLLPSRKHAR